MPQRRLGEIIASLYDVQKQNRPVRNLTGRFISNDELRCYRRPKFIPVYRIAGPNAVVMVKIDIWKLVNTGAFQITPALILSEVDDG